MHGKTFLKWMSPNPIDGGNGGNPPTPGNGGDVPPAAPVVEQPPTPGHGGDTPPTEDKPTPPAKTFTQAEVDRLAAEQRRRATQSLLKELGVEKLDDAKNAVKTARAIADTQKTDAQIIEEKDRQLQEANRCAQDAQLRAAFMARAGTRFVDAEAAFDLAEKRGLLGGLTLEEDGKTVTGLDETMDTLGNTFTFLKPQPGKQPPTSIGPAAPQGKSVARTDEDRRREYYGGGGGLGIFAKREDGLVLPNKQ